MRRRLIPLIVGVVALVVLAGCNVSSDVVVHPDGSGTYAVILTVPSGPTDPGAALFNAMKKAEASSAVPLQVVPYASGGENGAKASFAFRSLADLNAESARLASGGNGLGVKISRDASGWHFVADSSQGLVAPPGSAPSGSTGGVIDASALASVARLSVVVELPGGPGENNATTVTHSGTTSTFSWVLAAGRAAGGLEASTTFVGSQSTVHLASGLTPVAVAAAPGSGASGSSGTALMAVMAGVAVMVVGGALVLVRRRRRPLVDA